MTLVRPLLHHAVDPRAKRVNSLILAWMDFRKDLPEELIVCQLRKDLYQVRNAEEGWNPPRSAWPAHLLDSDPIIEAALEHYFLCRCWVGDGTQPAWEMRSLNGIYDGAKAMGISKRHGKNPTTPFDVLTVLYKELGVVHGELDLAASGKTAPTVSAPPKY